MVLSFRKIVLYDVKLLAMGHVTTIVSTVPSYGILFLWASLCIPL